MKSVSGKLGNQDWEEWTIQTVIFNVFIPALLIFLTSLQGGTNIKTASIVAAISITQAIANLYGKYKAGETPLPVNKDLIAAGEALREVTTPQNAQAPLLP